MIYSSARLALMQSIRDAGVIRERRKRELEQMRRKNSKLLQQTQQQYSRRMSELMATSMPSTEQQQMHDTQRHSTPSPPPTLPDPSVPTTPMATWSVSEVASFLSTLGPSFLPHARRMMREGIDGRQLVLVDEQDLKEVGIVSRIQRKAILQAILEVKQNEEAEKQKEESSASSIPDPMPPLMPVGVHIIRAHSLSGIMRLGSGNFGVTYRAVWNDPHPSAVKLLAHVNGGILTSPGTAIDVVIKVPRSRSGFTEWNELLAFVEVPPHRNIVPLLGICTDFPSSILEKDMRSEASNDRKGKMTKGSSPHCCCFVTLYIERGSLKDVLSSDDRCHDLLGGDLLDTSLASEAQHHPGSDADLRWSRLTRNATKLLADVAHGLAHLHSFNILHRDIAARNVLVQRNGSGLLADFGLSRKIGRVGSEGSTADGKGVLDPSGMYTDAGLESGSEGGAYYRLAQPEQSALPLRWLSPESLSEYLFSKASDTWMYGVMSWELWTRAHSVPFDDLRTYNQLLARVGGGVRKLSLPDHVPNGVANVIRQCWETEMEKRPTMAQVAQLLDRKLERMERRIERMEKGIAPDDEAGQEISLHAQSSPPHHEQQPSHQEAAQRFDVPFQRAAMNDTSESKEYIAMDADASVPQAASSDNSDNTPDWIVPVTNRDAGSRIALMNNANDDDDDDDVDDDDEGVSSSVVMPVSNVAYKSSLLPLLSRGRSSVSSGRQVNEAVTFGSVSSSYVHNDGRESGLMQIDTVSTHSMVAGSKGRPVSKKSVVQQKSKIAKSKSQSTSTTNAQHQAVMQYPLSKKMMNVAPSPVATYHLDMPATFASQSGYPPQYQQQHAYEERSYTVLSSTSLASSSSDGHGASSDISAALDEAQPGEKHIFYQQQQLDLFKSQQQRHRHHHPQRQVRPLGNGAESLFQSAALRLPSQNNMANSMEGDLKLTGSKADVEAALL